MKLVEAAAIAKTASVSFSKDYPLQLTYNDHEGITLEFILAPRVDNT